MFYTTTIKSVGSTGVIDAQGRRLNFIGYLPVKEGDTVYTDGKFIFGNAPPKGSPAIFDEQGGIPVLGDEYSLSDSDPKDELRGYFTTSGKYKKYGVKGDAWITNDKKTYAHDGSFADVDDANIIDAEIAEDGGVYAVEKIAGDWLDEKPSDSYTYLYVIRAPIDGVYDDTWHICGKTNVAEELDKVNPIISYPERGARKLKYEEYTVSRQLTTSRTDFARKGTAVIKPCELVIRKDGQRISQVNFADYVTALEEKAREPLIGITVPGFEPADDIDTRATLENFKIAPNGSWEALIYVDILAERTFTATNVPVEAKVWQYDETEDESISVEQFIHENPSLIEAVGGILSGWASTKAIYHCTITYTYTAEVTKRATYRSSAMSARRFFAKISSTTNSIEVISENGRNYPLYFPVYEYIVDSQYAKYTQNYHHDFYIRFEADWGGDATTLNRDFTATQSSYPSRTCSFRAVLDGTFEYLLDVWLGGTSYPIWHETSGTAYAAGIVTNLYYSYNMTNAPDYNNDIEIVDAEFSFPVQDDYSGKIKRTQNKQYENMWNFGGVYDKDGKRIIDGSDKILSGENNAYQWNMSLATLKGGGYLFGIHADPDRDIEGELFKIDRTGKVEQVGNGLKNFRLRELKKISKAKK